MKESPDRGNNNGSKMIIKICLQLAMSLVLIGVLLFITAGTVRFWNGWLFLLGVLIPIIAEISYFLKNDPEMLNKRMKTKENIKKQQVLIYASSTLTGCAALLPGIDYRFGWSHVPLWLVVCAFVLFEAGFFMYMEVMKQNRYASRIIEIQEGQKTIDTGLYAVIRHPMYLVIVITTVTMPLLLGSFYALIPAFLCCFVIVERIKEEEIFLKNELKGYDEYTAKVKYRLIPYIW